MCDEATTKYPKVLYHYTNLPTLALMLKNRTLRLMPLTGMDDPQENQTQDVANLGRFFFASCWTDDAKESIPMWNMYASLSAGVRIGLPPMPFRRYSYTKEQWATATRTPLENVSGGPYTSLMPVEDLVEGRFSTAFLDGSNVLNKIVYTDNREKLCPHVVESDDESLKLSMSCMGKYKNTYWQFQHEWRYLMCIFPFHILDIPLEQSAETFVWTCSLMAQGLLPAACNYYDLVFDDKALESLSITPSPRMSPGNRVLLESLLSTYGFEGALRNSQLEGLL